MFKQTDPLPRGIRNNNPMNIRENQRSDFDWEGEHDEDFDPDFEEFTKPIYGFRASARILRSYSIRGVNSVEDIISTWAPAEDKNDVEAYIKSICDMTGLERKYLVDHRDYADLFAAMTFHENGMQPYSPDVISNGIALAFKG